MHAIPTDLGVKPITLPRGRDKTSIRKIDCGKSLSLLLSSLLLSSLCIIVATLCLPHSALAYDASSSVGSCKFYDHLSQELGCHDEDYLVSYGAHYCREFKKHARRFSDEGRAILRDIRLCLQVELANTPGLTCENVKAIAQRSHATCYARHRFCRLSFMDKFVLFTIVAPSIHEGAGLADSKDSFAMTCEN